MSSTLKKANLIFCFLAPAYGNGDVSTKVKIAHFNKKLPSLLGRSALQETWKCESRYKELGHLKLIGKVNQGKSAENILFLIKNIVYQL